MSAELLGGEYWWISCIRELCAHPILKSSHQAFSEHRVFRFNVSYDSMFSYSNFRLTIDPSDHPPAAFTSFVFAMRVSRKFEKLVGYWWNRANKQKFLVPMCTHVAFTNDCNMGQYWLRSAKPKVVSVHLKIAVILLMSSISDRCRHWPVPILPSLVKYRFEIASTDMITSSHSVGTVKSIFELL